MGLFTRKGERSTDNGHPTGKAESRELKDEAQRAITVSDLCFSLVDDIMETFGRDKRLSPAKLEEASYACGNYLCWMLLEQDFGERAVQIAFKSYLRFLQGFNHTLLKEPIDNLIDRFNNSMKRMGTAVSESNNNSFNNPYRVLAKAIISEASAAPIYDEMLIMQVFMTLTNWNTRIVPLVAQLRLL